MTDKKEYYISTCGYCQKQYNYRLYHGTKLIIESNVPLNGIGYDIKISHGVCVTCKDKLYEELCLDKLVKDKNQKLYK